MIRTSSATITALLAWAAIGGLLILCLRLGWPAYAEAVPTKAFTLPMMIVRLSIGAIASVASGVVAARLDPVGMAVRATAVVLFLVSAVNHIIIWADYPAWYHLVYLGYLIPLTLFGGWLLASNKG